MSLFTSAKRPVTALDDEALKREVIDFPPEIPIVGQMVRLVYFFDDGGSVVKLETTVTSRESEANSVNIRVFSLTCGGRIGTQEFKRFKWDRISKRWSFWDMYDLKYRPAIVMF